MDHDASQMENEEDELVDDNVIHDQEGEHQLEEFLDLLNID